MGRKSHSKSATHVLLFFPFRKSEAAAFVIISYTASRPCSRSLPLTNSLLFPSHDLHRGMMAFAPSIVLLKKDISAL